MPATTQVANTSASLVGKTLATLDDSIPFLGLVTAVPGSPPDDAIWMLLVVGPPDSVQLWVRFGGVTLGYLDLGTLV